MWCTERNIEVKYRASAVDLNNFEEINTAKSTFIKEAFYDTNNNYFIIKLQNTYYHYCNFPSDLWDDFKQAQSFGQYYTSNIKGKYDCEENWIVPEY